MSITEAKEDISIDFYSDRECQIIWDKISKSSPSDHIYLNYKADMAICSIWQRDASKIEPVPADIFFAGIIPLLDCLITVDESGVILENGMEGFSTSMRIVIFEDYKEMISEAKGGTVGVGYMIQTIDGHSIIFPICICEGYDYTFTALAGAHNYTPRQKETYRSLVSQAKFCRDFQEWMTTWYGVQIALLHPTVKDIFQHSEAERIFNPNYDRKKSKRTTCYIKKHIINSGDVESAIHNNEHSFVRKTMVWYVIGHWRTYSDGRKVFVHPYWKGPLRDMKKNIDDGREREILIGDV